MFIGGMVGISALINYVDFGSFLIIFFNMIGVLPLSWGSQGS